MHVECGRAVFGKHSKFSTMRCRKLNFVLIDFEVGLLLTFLASMKAKVRLYPFWVFTRAVFKPPFSRFPVWSLDSKVFVLHVFSSFACKRKAKTVSKCSFLC